LESVLDKKLEMLKKSNNDKELLQHEKIQDFNQRMWETLHPGTVEPWKTKYLNIVSSKSSLKINP